MTGNKKKDLLLRTFYTGMLLAHLGLTRGRRAFLLYHVHSAASGEAGGESTCKTIAMMGKKTPNKEENLGDSLKRWKSMQ
jgi:hypothetical protein